jgi:hypothetical protein
MENKILCRIVTRLLHYVSFLDFFLQQLSVFQVKDPCFSIRISNCLSGGGVIHRHSTGRKRQLKRPDDSKAIEVHTREKTGCPQHLLAGKQTQ